MVTPARERENEESADDIIRNLENQFKLYRMKKFLQELEAEKKVAE